MNKIALFRVDAGGAIGAGHLMRCISLAHGFKKSNITSYFMVTQTTLDFITALPQFEFETLRINPAQSETDLLNTIRIVIDKSQQSLKLSSSVNPSKRLTHTNAHTDTHTNADTDTHTNTHIHSDNPIQFVVIDGYHFNVVERAKLHHYLKHSGITFVSIDDNGDQCAQHCDIIINPSANMSLSSKTAKASETASVALVQAQTQATANGLPNYAAINPNAKVISGENYRLLRPEFIKLTPKPYTQRDSLVVTLGGTDPKGYTDKVIDTLFALHTESDLFRQFFPYINIIVGAGFSHIPALQSRFASLPPEFKFIFNPKHIEQVFNQAKLAISAAGGSQFELFACRTPSLLLISYDNQWQNTQNIARNKSSTWCEIVDFRQSFDAPLLKGVIMNVLTNNKCLKMFNNTPKKPNDGAYHISQKLIQF